VWVGGEQAGGSHLRACAARVAGAAAAVMFIACERNGTARSVGDTIGEARRQRVGGDDTDTSLAAEGRRRNISPLDRERSRAAGHGRGEFAGWPNVLGHSPRASFDTNCRVA